MRGLGRLEVGEIYGMDNFHTVPKLSFPATLGGAASTSWYLPAAPRRFSLSRWLGPMSTSASLLAPTESGTFATVSGQRLCRPRRCMSISWCCSPTHVQLLAFRRSFHPHYRWELGLYSDDALWSSTNTPVIAALQVLSRVYRSLPKDSREDCLSQYLVY